MRYCCVPFCLSKKNRGSSITFHEFPSNLAHRDTWIQNVSRQGGLKGCLYQPKDFSVVCSLHFAQNDFRCGAKRRTIKPGAYPTIFPGSPHNDKTTKPSVFEHGNFNTHLNEIRSEVPSAIEKKTKKTVKQKCTSVIQAVQHSQDVTQSERTCQDIPLQILIDIEHCVPKENDAPEASDISKKSLEERRLFWKEVVIKKLEGRVLRHKRDANRLRSLVSRRDQTIAKLKETVKELTMKTEKYKYSPYQEFDKVVQQKDINRSAFFLAEQITNFNKKRPSFSDQTLNQYVKWMEASKKAFDCVRNLNVLKLPSRTTIKRYLSNHNILMQCRDLTDTQIENDEEIIIMEDDELLSSDNEEMISEDEMEESENELWEKKIGIPNDELTLTENEPNVILNQDEEMGKGAESIMETAIQATETLLEETALENVVDMPIIVSNEMQMIGSDELQVAAENEVEVEFTESEHVDSELVETRTFVVYTD